MRFPQFGRLSNPPTATIAVATTARDGSGTITVLTTGEVFYHKNHIQRTTIDSVKNKKWKII